MVQDTSPEANVYKAGRKERRRQVRLTRGARSWSCPHAQPPEDLLRSSIGGRADPGDQKRTRRWRADHDPEGGPARPTRPSRLTNGLRTQIAMCARWSPGSIPHSNPRSRNALRLATQMARINWPGGLANRLGQCASAGGLTMKIKGEPDVGGLTMIQRVARLLALSRNGCQESADHDRNSSSLVQELLP